MEQGLELCSLRVMKTPGVGVGSRVACGARKSTSQTACGTMRPRGHSLSLEGHERWGHYHAVWHAGTACEGGIQWRDAWPTCAAMHQRSPCCKGITCVFHSRVGPRRAAARIELLPLDRHVHGEQLVWLPRVVEPAAAEVCHSPGCRNHRCTGLGCKPGCC